MKRLFLTVAMASAILACSKPKEGDCVTFYTNTLPPPDTIRVKTWGVNTNNGFYSYWMEFDKPLPDTARWYTHWNTNSLSGSIPHQHVFKLDPNVTGLQYHISGIQYEGTGSIVLTTVDSLRCPNVVFRYYNANILYP